MGHDPDAYRDLVTPAVEAMQRLVDATFVLVEQRKLPEHDSIAMQELAEESSLALHPRAATPIADALSSVGQYLAAGCDHVRAMCTLYAAEPAVIYGDRVLLRAAIEVFSRAAWLSEPVGPRERARRGVNERLASMDDQLDVLRHAGQPRDASTDLYRETRLEVAHAYEAAGIGEVGREDGRVFVRPKRPGPTSVIKWFGDQVASPGVAKSPGRILQSLYSGYTHSSLWALMSALEMDAALPSDLTHMPGTAVAPIVAKAETAARSLGVAGAFLSESVNRYRSLMGWNDNHWPETQHAVEQVFDRYNL